MLRTLMMSASHIYTLKLGLGIVPNNLLEENHFEVRYFCGYFSCSCLYKNGNLRYNFFTSIYFFK